MATSTLAKNSVASDVLVSTAWVAEHLKDPMVRIVEVDVDTAAYNEGHAPGAIGWAWNTQLCDTVRRDIIPQAKFEELMATSGISNHTTVILYGDNNNWFAAWALWQMKIYGHEDVRLMNGGRKKWLAESRELTNDPARVSPKIYRAKNPDLSIRSFLPDVKKGMEEKAIELVDVRS